MGDRLVIKTGNITIVVKSVEESVGTTTSLANSAGGYVVSSKSGTENELVATITIKVPADKFEATMETLRKLAWSRRPKASAVRTSPRSMPTLRPNCATCRPRRSSFSTFWIELRPLTTP